MSTQVFGQSTLQIVCGTYIEPVRRLALQDVEKGSHLRNGRPVGTRTPDLYRVKVAL